VLLMDLSAPFGHAALFSDLIATGSIASAAKAVAELTRATVSQKKWQSEVREKANAAADAVEAIAKKGGLSAEALDTIRRGILGIAS